MKTFEKSPTAILDYIWDWNPWLNGDTINTYSFTIPEGLILLTDSIAAGKITAWLSGGTIHKTYMVTCQISTNNTPPRVNSRSAIFNIEH